MSKSQEKRLKAQGADSADPIARLRKLVTNNLWDMDGLDERFSIEIDALQVTVDRLTAALRGLKGNCFCQHGIGNPMYPYHSDACLAAQAALAPADPEPRT